jgi:hypothetical protein
MSIIKKYKNIWIILTLLIVGNFLLLGQLSAQQGGVGEIINEQLEELGQVGLPGEPQNPANPVVNLIRMLLGFLALVFLILILWAGFKWMTAAGNTETIARAKKIITSALIGLAIIFLSYAITAFVFEVVLSSA